MISRDATYSLWAVRGGVRLKKLRCTKAPSITAKRSANIKSSMGVTFVYDPDVDLLSDSLQPCLIVDGVESPIGVFRAGSVTENYGDGLTTVTVAAYDSCYVVQQNATTEILHLNQGDGYMQTIKQLLTSCGMTLYIEGPSGYTLQTDREDWDVGTSYLTIVNTLLSEMNYQSLWFNASGAAMLLPKTEASPGSYDHVYTPSVARIVDTYSLTTDLFDKPNVFTVVCSNPDLEECLYSTMANENLSSPLSIGRRGMRVVKLYKVDNIASQEALDDYARSLRYESMLGSEEVTITTELEAGHGIGDTVALDHRGHQGIYVEEGWSMTLGAGQKMEHTLRRVIYG